MSTFLVEKNSGQISQIEADRFEVDSLGVVCFFVGTDLKAVVHSHAYQMISAQYTDQFSSATRAVSIHEA